MRQFSTYIFDLDRTLYPHSSDILVKVDKRITEFCQKTCQVDFKQADKIRQKYYLQYGATLTGLMQEYNADPDEFLEFVHDIDYSNLFPCPKQIEAITSLKGRRLIYTNGSRLHAENILQRLQLTEYFEAIHDIKAANLQPKPSRHAFETFISQYNIDPKTAIFFDDHAINTKTAKDLGIYAIQVLEGKTPLPNDHCLLHSDKIIYSLVNFLKNHHSI